MFWILVPIWLTWLITEFYQEKHGTSYANSISNGAIAIFASVDWARYLYRLFSDGLVKFTFGVFLKFFIAFSVMVYGFYVIYLGIKRQRLVSFIGRIRWVTYILVMFTPIVYNVYKMDIYTLFGIILFFPLYYWVIEVFDRIVPEPRIEQGAHGSNEVRYHQRKF